MVGAGLFEDAPDAPKSSARSPKLKALISNSKPYLDLPHTHSVQLQAEKEQVDSKAQSSRSNSKEAKEAKDAKDCDGCKSQRAQRRSGSGF